MTSFARCYSDINLTHMLGAKFFVESIPAILFSIAHLVISNALFFVDNAYASKGCAGFGNSCGADFVLLSGTVWLTVTKFLESDTGSIVASIFLREARIRQCGIDEIKEITDCNQQQQISKRSSRIGNHHPSILN